MRMLFVLVPLLVGPALLVGQSAPPAAADQRPRFDAASVKPNRSPQAGINNQFSPGRFAYVNTPLDVFIYNAYGVRSDRVVGMPDWARQDKFDITATHSPEYRAFSQQQNQMLQRLLEERFSLRTHRETREMDTYALVTARRDGQLGEKMKPSERDCAPIIDAGNVKPRQGDGPPPCGWFVALINGFARLRLTGIRMPRFAGVLEPMTTRKIVDRTNLTGTYDIEMDFLPDPGLLGLSIPNSNALQQSDIPPLPTAIRDQLGLKLESERALVDVIVVDGVRPPTAN